MSGSLRRWAALAIAITTTGIAGAGLDDDKPVDVDDVVAQALPMVELIDRDLPKVITLVDIAKVQARLGRTDAARDTFRAAEQMASEMRAEGGYSYLWVARGQAIAGFEDDARDNRRRGIEWARNSRAAGSRLAVAASRSAYEGDLEGAEDIAEALRDGTAEERILIYGGIATEAARRGEIERARAAIATAEAEADRAKDEAKTSPVGPTYLSSLGGAECRLAIAEVKAGHVAEARARVERALARVEQAPEGTPTRMNLLARIAPAYRALGDDAKAKALVDRCVRIVHEEEPKLQTRAAALGRLAMVLIQEGERDAASGLIEEILRIADPFEAGSAGAVPAEALVALGRVEEARKFLDAKASARPAKAAAIRQIYRAEAMTGDRQARLAHERAEADDDPEFRVQALVGLLEGIADRRAKKKP